MAVMVLWTRPFSDRSAHMHLRYHREMETVRFSHGRGKLPSSFSSEPDHRVKTLLRSHHLDTSLSEINYALGCHETLETEYAESNV